MDAQFDPTAEATVSLKTWVAVSGTLLGAFLAVLNIQITNASLPYIEGGIGTGGVYGTWVSTAYLIGEIIVIPLTDFLSRVVSLRRYLLVNTALFLFFSVLCGHAHSLSEMIVFRALARLYRRRADPARVHHRHDHATALETGDRPGGVFCQRNVRAGNRANDRRLPDRLLRLALGVLRQPGARVGDARGALVYVAQERPPAWSAAPGRLAWHRLDGDRPRGLPDRP
jgi:hypothetical protein